MFFTKKHTVNRTGALEAWLWRRWQSWAGWPAPIVAGGSSADRFFDQDHRPLPHGGL